MQEMPTAITMKPLPALVTVVHQRDTLVPFHKDRSASSGMPCFQSSVGLPECPKGVMKQKKRFQKRQRIMKRKAFLEKVGILKGRGNTDQLNGVKKNSTECLPGNFVKPVPEEMAQNGNILTTSSRLWESNTGFSAGVLPSSYPNTPCPFLMPSKLVAVDCEMVGTGPRGCCSELARCSIVSYNGTVLYDKYIKPKQPVVDYRTPWSGIWSHHLQNAIPFNEAKNEVLQILMGKVVVGHALHNDFRVLGYFHPTHLIRDTSKQKILLLKAGFPAKQSVSLRKLAKELLHQNIQCGSNGHCSVQDARAAMELYKLVEAQWEADVQLKVAMGAHELSIDHNESSSHYMDDKYWPEDLHKDSI
uniref:Apoptosis-enhancing nuclease-like n=1 Tax=Erpetoichthys calabaricus TaxID=27687 RepID=A0A8C4TMK5_ERPCA